MHARRGGGLPSRAPVRSQSCHSAQNIKAGGCLSLHSDQPLNHMEVRGFQLFSLIASLLFMSDYPTNPFNLDTSPPSSVSIGWSRYSSRPFLKTLLQLDSQKTRCHSLSPAQMTPAINGRKIQICIILIIGCCYHYLTVVYGPLGSWLRAHYNVPGVPTASGAHNEGCGYL